MKTYLAILSLCLLPFGAAAQGLAPDSAQRIEEVVVMGAGKEQASPDRLPVAYTALSARQIERSGVGSPNDLSALVPNFYMPDYGSKLTSAVYIRGVGSRMNEPAVALYVDNIPYMDKSAFDFDLFDLAGVEVLRGSQGTLYGRNAMGGIINIRTASPLSRQGTRVHASYGSANTMSATASHACRVGQNVGLFFGGSYNQTDGFFTNEHNGLPANALQTGAARLRLEWSAAEQLRLSYTLSAECSEQRGYAYGMVDSADRVRNPSYDAPAGYSRTLLVHGLTLLHTGAAHTLSSSTSYQRMGDHMQLDQDFTPDDLFTLEQQQRLSALTQEVVVKSTSGGGYRWLFGAFAFCKQLDTQAPVSISSAFIARRFPTSPYAPQLTIVADSGSSAPLSHLRIPSEFEQRARGVAAFHQSTFENLLVEGLSLTVGMRLDYEQVALRYRSSSRISVKMTLPPTMGGATSWSQSAQEPLYSDEVSNGFAELLPKVALQYAFGKNRYKAYASAAKGYTAGGYNTNLFADLVQDKLKPTQAGASVVYRQPEGSDAVGSAIYYKPEYSWCYEVGGAASLWDRRLSAAAAVFYVDTRNQQVAHFVPSGLGRVMKNAGRSHSYGAELSLGARAGSLSAHATYGYTHATFERYTDSVQLADGTAQEVSYRGSRVPFAPQHTLSLGTEYDVALRGSVADKLTLGATYTGAGKIYFTAANDAAAAQDFYGVLTAKASVEKGMLRLSFWANNLLNTRYKVFYFESMGSRFAQVGKPLQLGVGVGVRW